MTLCSKCKKRVAVIFIARISGSERVSEGYCLRCAKELHIADVDKMMQDLGINEEDIDTFDENMLAHQQEFEENITNMLHPADPSDTPEEDSDASEDAPKPAEADSDPSHLGKSPLRDFESFIKQQLGGMNAAFGGTQESAPRPRQGKPKQKFLSSYCTNLTEKAAHGELDRVVGRKRELARVIEILCRRQKNNPCLIGEPGVGKTAIAEALAQLIADGQAPRQLRDKTVWQLDMTAMVAGTQFRGQFESRIKSLIDEIKADGNVILVIDEIHSIVSAGDAEGSMNAANILKPALSKGEIRVIGATTMTEYRKYIEKDSALERRFQPVIVEEPSIADTIEILKGIAAYYASFHQVVIPEETLRQAALLSERYITDRFLPDKAIDLIDEASAYLSLNSGILDQIDALNREKSALEVQQSNLEAQQETDEDKLAEKYRQLADLRTRSIQLDEQEKALQTQLSAVVLTPAHLARVIENWTGIPASSITENEFERLSTLDQRLKSRVVGQDQAVDALCRAVRRSRAGVMVKRKPLSFIFAGSTGVGKTELVKTLAADLFQTPDSLIRLDMSEFMEKHTVARLIGAPPGYVGYDDAGQLTEKIRRKPYSVVLFDEIEKAHPDVLNILLQILDDGRVTDAQGRTVNFENTVIVMTTNAGSNYASNTPGFTESSVQLTEDRTMKALSDFLRPEFLNRVDEIITFRSLEEQDFCAIARIMLDDLAKTLAERGLHFTYTDASAQKIAHDSFSRQFGARNMRRYIQTHVEDELANRIIANYAQPFTDVSLDTADGQLVIRCTTAAPQSAS